MYKSLAAVIKMNDALRIEHVGKRNEKKSISFSKCEHERSARPGESGRRESDVTVCDNPLCDLYTVLGERQNRNATAVEASWRFEFSMSIVAGTTTRRNPPNFTITQSFLGLHS